MHSPTKTLTDNNNGKRKGKEEYLYTAILLSITKCSDMDNTVLPANYTMSPFLVSVHQMALSRLRQQTSNCSLLLIYQPRKDERLCWPGWLTYSGPFTHISGYPSALG